MCTKRQHIVLCSNAEDGAVALAIEPSLDGDVLGAYLIGGLGGNLLAIELESHIGHFLVGDGIVEVAHNAEIVALAQGIGVDVFVETHVHTVAKGIA